MKKGSKMSILTDKGQHNVGVYYSIFLLDYQTLSTFCGKIGQKIAREVLKRAF